MKLLLIFTILTSSAFAYSSDRMQVFRRANNKEVMLEAGYTTVKTQLELESSGSTYESTTSSANYFVDAEFGITEDIAVGTSIAKHYSDGEEGMDDYHFFTRGQFNNFFYGADVFISPEEASDESFYTGGNYISLSLGYQFSTSFGVNASITPEHGYEYEDDDTDFVSGSSYQVGAFYEIAMNQNSLGFGASYLYAKANTEDGDPNGDDSRAVAAQGYYNAHLMGFELNPTLIYMHFLPFNEDLKINTMMLNITVRKRF